MKRYILFLILIFSISQSFAGNCVITNDKVAEYKEFISHANAEPEIVHCHVSLSNHQVNRLQSSGHISISWQRLSLPIFVHNSSVRQFISPYCKAYLLFIYPTHNFW